MKNIFLAIIVLAFYSATAQKQFKQKWSALEKGKNFVHDFDTVGVVDNAVYYYCFNPKLYGQNHLLIKVDDKLRRVQTKLKLKYKGLPVTFEKVLVYEDVLYVFSSYLNFKTNTKYLLVQSGNPDNLNISDRMTVIAQGKVKNDKASSWNDIIIASSPNRKNISINVLVGGKKSSYQVNSTILNTDLDILWNKTIKIRSRGEVELKEAIITNNQELLFLSKRETSNASKEKNKKYNFTLHQINEQEKKAFEYEVELEGKSVNDLKIIKNELGNYAGYGFYSNKNALLTDGVITFEVNPESREITHLDFQEFNIEYITMGLVQENVEKLQKKDSKNNDVSSEFLIIKTIEPLESGEILLIGEPTSFISGTESDYKYCGPINLIALNSQYEITWSTKVLKSQMTSAYSMFTSFFFKRFKNKLYFFYNDHVDNYQSRKRNDRNETKEDVARETFTGSAQTSATVCAILDLEDKTQSFEVLATHKQKGSLFIPRTSCNISENEFIFASRYSYKSRFGKFTIITRK